MKNFEDILKFATNKNVKIAVAAAHDKEVLSAIKMAMKLNLVTPILVGDKVQILKYAEEIKLNLDNIEIIFKASFRNSSKISS